MLDKRTLVSYDRRKDSVPDCSTEGLWSAMLDKRTMVNYARQKDSGHY